MTDFKCSVIIATYNRSALLVRLLDSLRQQDIGHHAFEVIVVDDGSVDDTAAVIGSFDAPFRLLSFSQENQGPAAARNVAIQAASSEVIISLDDDVTAAPDLLRRHVRAHQKAGVLCAMGAMVLPPGRHLQPWLEWEARVLEKQYEEMRKGAWHASPRQFYTANASFNRRIALSAGLFDPQFRRAEDVEFAYRMERHGSAFQFLPEAVVHHAPNRTFAEWLRVPEQYGYYDVVMSEQEGQDFVLKLAAREFHSRNTILRLCAHLLIGRAGAIRSFVSLASFIGKSAFLLNQPKVSQYAYGAIFNIKYWQGISQALGGTEPFWTLIRMDKR